MTACTRRHAVGCQAGTLLRLALVLWAAFTRQALAQSGQALFDTAGTFTWTAPAGVNSVSVACVGGGGGAGTYNKATGVGDACGGGGGGFAFANNITVTPGTNYTVTVGSGGSGAKSSGGPSWFISTATMYAGGGGGSYVNATTKYNNGGQPGNWSVGSQYGSAGGGAGGWGGDQTWEATQGDIAGAGGGAGGYSGAGGHGGSYPPVPPAPGAGGGAGGGLHTVTQAGGGGGTGLLGAGSNGAAGTSTSPGGGAGSGGGAGAATGVGGKYGGGAGGKISSTATNVAGGVGACRIIWGAGRAYPSTNTADVVTTAPPPPPSNSTAPQVLYDTAGTFTWTAPAGVTSVSVACVGGGGGAGTYNKATGVGDACGGGGGGFAFANNITVTPGTNYTVTVGSGGSGAKSSGGPSWFISTAALFAGGGGGSYVNVTTNYNNGGQPGNWSVGSQYGSAGGGAGGWGGDQTWEATRGDIAGAGGGAGGYSGAGGHGGSYPPVPPAPGAGGGAGGGLHTVTQAGGGGGTGLLGAGSNGAAGTSTSPGGGAGSGGGAGAATGVGGKYGGGAGGKISSTATNIAGGSGACRIIWGAGRAYPNTNTGDLAALPPPPPIQVAHRLLILTSPGFTSTDFLVKVFSGYGLPFDQVVFNSTAPVDPATYLYNLDGSGRYSGLIIYPSLDASGLLGAARVAQLEQYQRTTGARLVRFGSAPDAFGIPIAACSSNDTSLTFTAAAPLGISGIRSSANMSASGLYRCSGVLPLPAATSCTLYSVAGSYPTVPCNVTAVMQYGTSPPQLAAGVVTYNDTREALFFTHDCASWTPTCMLVAHFVTSWVTKNIIPGQRRTMLSVQVDDFFVDTQIYGRPSSYRTTPADLLQHANWTAQLNALLPAGSRFKMEMAFNGNGIPTAAADNAALNSPDGLSFACQEAPQYIQLGCSCWFTSTYETCSSAVPYCKNCTRNWLRVPDINATSYIPEAYNSSSWLPMTNWTDKDPLAAMVASRVAANEFFWCSHTFTHQNLQNTTAADCLQQWKLNQVVAARLGLTPATGLAVKGVVTPAITGLSNVDNLNALLASGYTSAVGDNTWAYLRNDAAPYTTLKTSVAKFGADGITIIPRWATEIYFNVNDTASEMDEYNTLYRSFFGYNSTFQQVLDREATRVTRDALLALRHDSHMFHQANMATAGGTVKGLLQQWVEAVLNNLNTLVAWPVESLGMDDLLALFQDREQRDACALTYTLTIDRTKNAVTSIKVASGGGLGSCAAPLLATADAALNGTSSSGPATSSGSRAYRIPVAAAGGNASLATSNMPW